MMRRHVRITTADRRRARVYKRWANAMIRAETPAIAQRIATEIFLTSDGRVKPVGRPYLLVAIESIIKEHGGPGYTPPGGWQ